MPDPKPQLSPADLETLVLDVVTAEGRAVTVTDIHRAMPKALRPAAKMVSSIVAAMAEAKRLFRHGRRYAARPDRSLHDRVLAAAAEDARTAADLAKQLGVSTSRVRETIRELANAGELHAHPQHRYAAHPPSAADLLRPELDKLFARATKLGIDEKDAKSALQELLGGSVHPSSADIVATIRELDPEGSLVYLPHLRTALAAAYPGKSSFDRAVLALLARGTVQLQSHPTPSLLGSAEREAMIDDGRGGYFSAIGLR